MMNKKGDLPSATLGEFIIVVAGGIIVIVFVSAILGFVAPTISGFGCGVNVAVKSAFLSNTLGIVDPPLLLCNQYQAPIKINAADFGACTGIASFCKGAKGTLLDDCYKQCARIQIDKLTDSCWAMGGKGRYDLVNILDKITAGVGALPGIIGTAIASPVLTPVMAAAIKFYPDAPETNKLAEGIRNTLPKKEVIIRCYRFQIINPGVLPSDKKTPFTIEDLSFGKSQLAYTATAGGKVQSLGGSGVAAVNPGEGMLPEMNFDQAVLLEYGMTDARQVCYIAYYQMEKSVGGKQFAVMRSCDSWVGFGGSFKFLN